MTERDDHAEDRRRPAGPAWATVPTMQWARVAPEDQEDDESGPRPGGRRPGRRPPTDPSTPSAPSGTERDGGERPLRPGASDGRARGVARPAEHEPDLPIPPPEAAAAVRFTSRPTARTRPADAPRRGDEHRPGEERRGDDRRAGDEPQSGSGPWFDDHRASDERRPAADQRAEDDRRPGGERVRGDERRGAGRIRDDERRRDDERAAEDERGWDDGRRRPVVRRPAAGRRGPNDRRGDDDRRRDEDDRWGEDRRGSEGRRGGGEDRWDDDDRWADDRRHDDRRHDDRRASDDRRAGDDRRASDDRWDDDDRWTDDRHRDDDRRTSDGRWDDDDRWADDRRRDDDDRRGGGDRRTGDDRRTSDDRRGAHPNRPRGTGRASVAGASPPARKPRPLRPGPVFTGAQGIPGGLRSDIVEALTAPTPPGGMRFEPPPPPPPTMRGVPAEADPADPVSAPPVSAPPVSAPPASGPASPVSAPPGSGAPAGEPASSAPDPEQTLSTWNWVFDPDTLREVADDKEQLLEIRSLLTAKLNGQDDNAPRARLLSLRAVVSRILGDLQKALADGKLALAHAEATGELRRIAIAQARLAHVLQWRGEFEEADRLFTLANSTELPDRLRATMYQHSGKCAYDQGRYIEACNHFEMALELRKTEDPEMIAHTELALDAVFRKVAENGWGPYPRNREEILQIRRPPTPALDEQTGLWGFTDAEGETRVPANFADVQPFRDGVAWVQRPGQETWELIDEGGESLIPTDAGYLGVSSFSDGLAWVSRDGTARWIAIDKANTVAISTGFEDVRPFRRGMAAVRRGGRWGAVDGIGRAVVPFRYDSFATALSDGRYIDGFSDEGLAVVELSGRKGVVDRAGRVLVEPVHPALVIHPVAFLITDGAHRWGALDRRGRMLIAPSHPSRMAVTEEIDRLLVDARPML